MNNVLKRRYSAWCCRCQASLVCYWLLFHIEHLAEQEVFSENVVLKHFVKIAKKHLSQSLFLNKVAGVRSAILLKRNSGTCIFLWVLRNFKERLFHRTPLVATSFLFNNISWKNLILDSLSQTSYFSEKINLAFAFINYFYASIQFCTPWKRQKTCV